MSYYDEEADRDRPTKQDVADYYDFYDDDRNRHEDGDWVKGRRIGGEGRRKRSCHKKTRR